ELNQKIKPQVEDFVDLTRACELHGDRSTNKIICVSTVKKKKIDKLQFSSYCELLLDTKTAAGSEFRQIKLHCTPMYAKPQQSHTEQNILRSPYQSSCAARLLKNMKFEGIENLHVLTEYINY
ncbi:Hypothetical predicted protein, partial [Paramuricea clavata]